MSASQAEDIVQDTFLAALKNADKFQGKSSEKTWLFAILKNKIIDHFRRKSKSSEREMNFESPFQNSGLMMKHWNKERGPAEWESAFEEKEEKDELSRIFHYCLSRLPERLSTVFSMKVIKECDSDEICKEVGISASNYWVTMHRARLQLRECMEKHWLKK